MSKIKDIIAYEILDSRGNPTLEVVVKTSKGIDVAAVPSGASTGEYEASELRDGSKRYGGKGVLKAIRNVEKIKKKLIGIDCREQSKIDSIMIKLDGTDTKKKLGANAILGVSLACARAGASASGKDLVSYLAELAGTKPKMPRLFFNVLNGGKHADSKLAVQELMIVPKFSKASKNIQAASEVYHSLKNILHSTYGAGATNVGDEGGFALEKLHKVEDALKLLQKAISKAGYKGKVDLAMDCAASEFYANGKYIMDGKKLSSKELLKYYDSLIKKFGIISIEDPFNEEDFESFSFLKNVQVVGDDLTVTNPERIEVAIREKSCTCLLLKVNQIGTLTESLESFNLATKAGWKVMVSHRSGETTDTFIADLALALGCGQLKAGAPCRGERTAKYNQLLRLEQSGY